MYEFIALGELLLRARLCGLLDDPGEGDGRRLGRPDELVVQQLRGRGSLVRVLHQTSGERGRMVRAGGDCVER